MTIGQWITYGAILAWLATGAYLLLCARTRRSLIRSTPVARAAFTSEGRFVGWQCRHGAIYTNPQCALNCAHPRRRPMGDPSPK